MAKKEENKPKNNGETKKKNESFDYKAYVEKTFTNPKAFIYYVIVNDLTFKSKEEVDKTYNIYKEMGGA